MNGVDDHKSDTSATISSDRLARLLLRNVMPGYILNQRYGEALVNNLKQYIEENCCNCARNGAKDDFKSQPALQIYQKSIIDNNQFTPSNCSFMGNVNINIFSKKMGNSRNHASGVDEFQLSEKEKKYMWLVLDMNHENLIPQQSYESVSDKYLYLLYKYFFEDKFPSFVPNDATGFVYDDVTARYNHYERLNATNKMDFLAKSEKFSNRKSDNNRDKSKKKDTLMFGIIPHNDMDKAGNSHLYCSSFEMSLVPKDALIQDMQKLYKGTDFFKQINFNLPFKFYSFEKELIMENFKTYVDLNCNLQTRSFNDLKKLVNKQTSSSNPLLKNFTYIFRSANEIIESEKLSLQNDKFNKNPVHCYANSPLFENEIDSYYFEVQLFGNNRNLEKQPKSEKNDFINIKIGFLPSNTDNFESDANNAKKTLKQNIEKFCKKVYFHDPILSKHDDKFDDFVTFMFNEYQRNNYKCYFESILHEQKVLWKKNDKELDPPRPLDKLNHVPFKSGENLEKELRYIFDYKLFKYKNYFLFKNSLCHKTVLEENGETVEYSISDYHSQTDIDFSDQDMSDYDFESDESVSSRVQNSAKTVIGKGEINTDKDCYEVGEEKDDGEEMASEVTSSTGRTRPRRKLISSEKSTKRPSTASLNSEVKTEERFDSSNSAVSNKGTYNCYPDGAVPPNENNQKFPFHESVPSTKTGKAHGRRSLQLPIRNPYRNHIWGQPVELFQQHKHDDIDKDAHRLTKTSGKKRTKNSGLSHLATNSNVSGFHKNYKNNFSPVLNDVPSTLSAEYSRLVSHFHGINSTNQNHQEMDTQTERRDHNESDLQEEEEEEEENEEEEDEEDGHGDTESSAESEQDDDEYTGHGDEDVSDSAEEEFVSNLGWMESDDDREEVTVLNELASYVTRHRGGPSEFFKEKFGPHQSSKYRNQETTCFTKNEEGLCMDTGLLNCKMSDVVGVGINYVDKEFFVTKNGKLMEVIDLNRFESFDCCIPFVHLKQKNVGVMINYGNFNQKFLFDCDTYFSNKRKRACLGNNKHHKLSVDSRQAFFNCNMKNANPEISTIINNYFVNKQMLGSSSAFMSEVQQSIDNNETQLKAMFGSTHSKYLKSLEFDEFCATLQGFVNNLEANGTDLNVDEISDFIVKKFGLPQKDLEIEYHLKVFSIHALFIRACAEENTELISESLQQSKSVFDKFVKNNETLFSKDWSKVCGIFATTLAASKAEQSQLLQSFGKKMHKSVIARLEKILGLESTKKFPAVNEALKKYQQSLDKISNKGNQPKSDPGNHNCNQELNDLEAYRRVCRTSGLSQILDFYNE